MLAVRNLPHAITETRLCELTSLPLPSGYDNFLYRSRGGWLSTGLPRVVDTASKTEAPNVPRFIIPSGRSGSRLNSRLLCIGSLRRLCTVKDLCTAATSHISRCQKIYFEA